MIEKWNFVYSALGIGQLAGQRCQWRTSKQNIYLTGMQADLSTQE